MSRKKGNAYRQFEALARKLIAVPKSEVDQQVDEYNKRKEQRKRAKKKRS